MNNFEMATGYRSLMITELPPKTAILQLPHEELIQLAKDCFDFALVEILRSTGEWHWELEEDHIGDIASEIAAQLSESQDGWDALYTLLREYSPEQYHTPTELLTTGYFVRGNQRITRESPSDAVVPAYYFWDDWDHCQFQVGASSIAELIRVKQVDLAKWSWLPNLKKKPASTQLITIAEDREPTEEEALELIHRLIDDDGDEGLDLTVELAAQLSARGLIHYCGYCTRNTILDCRDCSDGGYTAAEYHLTAFNMGFDGKHSYRCIAESGITVPGLIIYLDESEKLCPRCQKSS
jgi:hypothetical protein